MPVGLMPDADHILQYAIKGTKNSYPWVNVGYLQYAGTIATSANLNAVASAIAAAWNTNVAPLCFTTVLQKEVAVVDLTNRGAAIGGVTGLSNAGTRTGTDLPNQVAAVISWKINRRYRGGHPRSYWPAGAVADVTVGRTWATAFQTSLTTAAGAFRTALNAITWSGATMQMVSVNFITHNPTTKVQEWVVPPVPYTIQSGAAHGRVDTQRRRLGKETP